MCSGIKGSIGCGPRVVVRQADIASRGEIHKKPVLISHDSNRCIADHIEASRKRLPLRLKRALSRI